MPRILAISSQVARGHVGLSAALPALQALRQDVIALPTVLLSNHPGHAHVAGLSIPPADLSRMLDAMAANGWLEVVDSVLTGYLPSAGHVAVAVDAITRVRARKPSALAVVDPVLGDDPKGLYLDAAAAAAIRDTLVPLADVLTPNRFELGWLTGADVSSPVEVARAASTLSAAIVCVTSAVRRIARTMPRSPTSPLRGGVGGGGAVVEVSDILSDTGPRARRFGGTMSDKMSDTLLPPPLAPPRKGEGSPTADVETSRQEIVSLLIADGVQIAAAVPCRQHAPQGTGDLLAGLLAGHLASGRAIADAFARAIAGVEVAVAASVGQDELALEACLPTIAAAAPWPLEPMS